MLRIWQDKKWFIMHIVRDKIQSAQPLGHNVDSVTQPVVMATTLDKSTFTYFELNLSILFNICENILCENFVCHHERIHINIFCCCCY